MKKYFVIGNPIDHSLSPKLHNYWMKENNINAVYEKKLIKEDGIEKIISEIKDGKIDGINVTVPFKKKVISFLDIITPLAKETQSVNTIYKKDGKVVGDNTDVGGFINALEHIKYNVKGKKVLILGAGGVAPSIISALNKMGCSEISLSNRTKEKADNLKKIYRELKIVNWGELPDFDMIINATSLGLNEKDEIKVNYSNLGPKKFFYDIIYNPKKTNFLTQAKKFSNQIENGKCMFAYQAQIAFEIWHKIRPKVDEKVLELIEND